MRSDESPVENQQLHSCVDCAQHKQSALSVWHIGGRGEGGGGLCAHSSRTTVAERACPRFDRADLPRHPCWRQALSTAQAAHRRQTLRPFSSFNPKSSLAHQ